MLAERLAEVERVQPTATAVVGEPVRMRPDLDPTEQLLVGAAEDAHAGCLAVAREEQVVLLVDQDAGDAGQVRERAQERSPLAVEDVDAVGAGVRHVHAPAGAIDVCVVEARRLAGRHRDEADADEAHSSAPARPRLCTTHRGRRRRAARARAGDGRRGPGGESPRRSRAGRATAASRRGRRRCRRHGRSGRADAAPDPRARTPRRAPRRSRARRGACTRRPARRRSARPRARRRPST